MELASLDIAFSFSGYQLAGEWTRLGQSLESRYSRGLETTIYTPDWLPALESWLNSLTLALNLSTFALTPSVCGYLGEAGMSGWLPCFLIPKGVPLLETKTDYCFCAYDLPRSLLPWSRPLENSCDFIFLFLGFISSLSLTMFSLLQPH